MGHRRVQVATQNLVTANAQSCPLRPEGFISWSVLLDLGPDR